MFSVVIPTYEGAQKILTPIKSLNAQTFRDFEVIFVDDCSPTYDEFERAVADHAQFPYRILRQETRANQVAARALGVRHSGHEYICFLDHDDSWVPTKLEAIKAAIEAHPNPTQTLFYHRLRCQYSSGKAFIYPSRGIRPKESVPEYLFFGNGMIQSSSMTFHRASSKVIPFNTASPPHDDWDFAIEAEGCGMQFKYINKTLAEWNVRRMAGVSLRDSASVSMNWFRTKEGLFNNRARVAFFVNVIFPKLAAEGKIRAAIWLLARQATRAPMLTLVSGIRLASRTLPKILAR